MWEEGAGAGPDGSEGETVERGRAEQVEGAAVLRGGVSLVRGEAVAGVLGVVLAHEAVPMDLGYDGGGGDGE
jgi:hypothetical protein